MITGGIFVQSLPYGPPQQTHQETSGDQRDEGPEIINLNDISSTIIFANGLKIDGGRTYWVMETQYGQTLCLPAVSFVLRNTSSAPIDSLTFNAQFLDTAAQTVFSEARAYSFKQPGPLPPQFKRGIVLESDKGFDPGSGLCSPGRLSGIKFDVIVSVDNYRAPIEVARGTMQTSNILAHGGNADMETLAEQAIKRIPN